jgi:hypothetical protein
MIHIVAIVQAQPGKRADLLQAVFNNTAAVRALGGYGGKCREIRA